MDWLEAILGFWEMYHTNPIFWIVLIPFMLWWLNFLKKQADEMGIKKLLIRVFYYTVNKLLNRRTEQQYSVTPSPRSGSPVNFWKDIAIWPMIMGLFVIFIAVYTTIPSFSLKWWTIIGWSILIIIGIMGIPIYLMALTVWLQTNKAIKKAIQRLRQLNISNASQIISYFDVFVGISGDLRMGLDPRVLPITYPHYQIDALSFLNELVSLGLVRPDKKMTVILLHIVIILLGLAQHWQRN